MARSTFAEFGNALYTGEKSINFIGRRKTWYLIAAVMIVIAIVGPLLRGGFTFGIGGFLVDTGKPLSSSTPLRSSLATASA